MAGRLTVEELREGVAGLPDGDPLHALPPDEREAILDRMIHAQNGAVLIEDEGAARIWLAYVDKHFWQPARVLFGRGVSRSAGFPAEPIDLVKMREWCKTTCRGRWAVETRTAALQGWADAGATYWFESPSEAYAFAMRWLPMKCV